jgi:hypothetical protein
MMTQTFTADAGAMMSPRTIRYVEAMLREGEGFDYYQWLKGDHDEQIQAKRVSAASAWRQAGPGQLENRLSTFDSPHGLVCAAPKSMATFLPLPRPTTKSASKLRESRPKALLVRRLEGVRDAWDEFQTDRARDAVYGYLEAVFAIVMHFKVRRRTKRLLRHAFEFADQPFDRKADLFTAVIRCTCGDAADDKMISKWARALRYVARRKPPETRLKAFMKDTGGVNACAARYAKHKRRRWAATEGI